MDGDRGAPLRYDDPHTELSTPGRSTAPYPGGSLPDSNHIRLIELWEPVPGEMTLSFRVAKLDEIPEFWALSYTWGTSYRKDRFLINIADDKKRLWWIDALCINQDDIQEKNEQVKLMRTIYGKAARVCVWLGEPDTTSLDLLQKITHRVGVREMLFDQDVYEKGMLSRLGLLDIADPAWTSLINFISCPYFTRIWVLQELVMANKPRIRVACGRLKFSWFLLAAPVRWMRSTNLQQTIQTLSLRRSQTPLITGFHDMLTLSLTMDKSLDILLPLEQLLRKSYELESTDPRDRIIALLGLVSKQYLSVSKINIDYGQPVADFFRDVTGTIIVSNRSLGILSLVTDKSFRKIAGLPSWVPDYTSKGRLLYENDRTSITDGTIEIDWNQSSNILSFDGCIPDELDLVAKATTNSTTREAGPADALLAWFGMLAESVEIDMWDLLIGLNDPCNMKSVGEAFWRCMLNDYVGTQCPAPWKYQDHFVAALYSAFFEQKMATDSADSQTWLGDFSLAVLSNLTQRDLLQEVKIDHLGIMFYHLCTREDVKHQYSPPKWVLPETWVRVEAKQLLLGPPGDSNAFFDEMRGKATDTQFFITKAGRMGRGPLSIQHGDCVAIAKGTDQVFLLRRALYGYELVGECYVYGLMHGEAQGDAPYQKISLV